MKIVIVMLIMATILFSSELLSCKEQNRVFLKYSQSKITGGKQTLRYNTRTKSFFMDKEYNPKEGRHLSLNFRNKTNSTYKIIYKVYPNPGLAVIKPGAASSVVNYNQVKELLSCKYDIKKIEGSFFSKPTYEFYSKI